MDWALTSGVIFHYSFRYACLPFSNILWRKSTTLKCNIYGYVSIFKFRIENKKLVYIYGKYTITVAISLGMFCCTVWRGSVIEGSK